MIQSKRINMIIFIAMACALLTVTFLVVVGNSGAIEVNKSEPAYATKIFGTDIISVEIIADESDWQEMLDNAISEQFIMADVIVNGTKFKNVGIRPKGNSSLSQVARSDSDRYSFRLQFDEYIKKQTCFGLKSFVINNMLSDNTYIKEYVSYDLMKEAGVNTPYFGFADITVNGEKWGFYLAIELYNESYEQRVYGDTSGMLYNVKSMEMGGNEGNNLFQNTKSNDVRQDPGNLGQRPQWNGEIQPDEFTRQNNNEAQYGEFPWYNNGEAQPLEINGDRGGFKMRDKDPGGNSGGSLAYIDDNPNSYSAIFDNVIGKGKKSDYQRVITALKALSEGRDIEKYFDVDQILRYLAAHTFVVNLDSYSSNMAQNYYIYENKGEITILPWDYNMAWGGFQSGDTSSVINFPIDTPVSGVEMSSRPLLEKLFANAEYLALYHSYLQQLIDNYFADGKFESKVNELDQLIKEYVKYDVSSFCTYEDYEKAVSAFITLGNLRAKSVQGQLNGIVPSTQAEQSANPEKLISAGELNLQILGGMGGGNKDGGGQNGDKGGFTDRENMLDRKIIQQAILIIQGTNGEITDEVKAKLKEIGLTEEQIELLSAMGIPESNGNMEEDNNQKKQPEKTGAPILGTNQSTYSTNNIVLTAVLAVILLVAILMASKLERKY